MDLDLYTLLKIVHIVTVVVGIGTVSLNGIYGAKAKAAGPNGGAAISRANFDVSMVAELFIYAIPVTGIAMLFANDGHGFEFADTWVWLSTLLYVVALGISHAVVIPSHRRMNEVMAAGPPTAEAEALEKKLAGGGTALDLLAVVIIVLMVWKPGT